LFGRLVPAKSSTNCETHALQFVASYRRNSVPMLGSYRERSCGVLRLRGSGVRSIRKTLDFLSIGVVGPEGKRAVPAHRISCLLYHAGKLQSHDEKKKHL